MIRGKGRGSVKAPTHLWQAECAIIRLLMKCVLTNFTRPSARSSVSERALERVSYFQNTRVVLSRGRSANMQMRGAHLHIS